MLCWNLNRLRKFKVKAKPILYRYFIEVLRLAIDSNTADVQPVLMNLLLDLLPVAFPNNPNLSELEVGRFEYYGAAIQHCYGKTVIYSGITDLSIIYKPMGLCIGGFKKKVSTSSMVQQNDSSKMNAIGVRAVAQTGTQILGAAQRLKSVDAVVDNLSMLTTNGWQWVYVKRQLTDFGEYSYRHFEPITLGEISNPEPAGKKCADEEDEESRVTSEMNTTSGRGRRKHNQKADYSDASATAKSSGKSYSKKKDAYRAIIAKPCEDICFDKVCHLLAMMFDNTEFLWKQLKRSSMSSSRTMLSMKVDDDENDGDRDDVDEEGSDHGDENRGICGPTTTRSEIRKVNGSGTGKGNVKGKWSSGRKNTVLQTRNMNVNEIPGAELTMRNLMRYNLGY